MCYLDAVFFLSIGSFLISNYNFQLPKCFVYPSNHIGWWFFYYYVYVYGSCFSICVAVVVFFFFYFNQSVSFHYSFDHLLEWEKECGFTEFHFQNQARIVRPYVPSLGLPFLWLKTRKKKLTKPCKNNNVIMYGIAASPFPQIIEFIEMKI